MPRAVAGEKKNPTNPARRGKARARGKSWYPAFLDVIADSMNVRAACQAALIDSSTVYDRRKTDAKFSAAWDAAMNDACDKAEAELYRRAVEGVETTRITRSGEAVTITEYDSDLLKAFLRAHRPDKYREKQEITGAGGGPVTIKVVYDEPKA